MFQYDPLDNDHDHTVGFMPWHSRHQQKQQHNPFHTDKSLESDWIHQQLHFQPLSDQPFDFLDTNASIGSVMTDGNSTDTSMSQQHQHQQPQGHLHQEHEYQGMNEEEGIWAMDTTTHAPYNTLSWDTRNSHFPSYEQTQLADRNIGTPFITEVPRSLFEPLIRRLQDPSNTAVIHEAELVKSLIQAITGLPSIYFYWDQQQNAFKQRYTHYRLLGVSASAIQPVLDQLLLFGTRIKGLEFASQQCQLQPEIYGLTGVAFGCCLQDLLMHIQQTTVTVFSTGNHESMTVLKLYHSIQSLAAIVDKLHGLCQIQQQQQRFTIPKGASLLNLLQREISGFDLASNGGNSALYRDICLIVLSYTSVPYSNMLSRWLHFNDTGSDDQSYGDPYNEFFIGKKSTTNRHDLLQGYKIRSDIELPYFIDKGLALYILRSGISVRLLNLSKPDHPLFELNDSISLKFSMSSTDNEAYMLRLQRVCEYIRSYNTTGSIAQYRTTTVTMDNDDHDTNQGAMQHDIPTLPPLADDAKQSGFSIRLMQLLRDETSHSIPTFDTITLQSYIVPIQTWCPLLNESFMISFLNQFKLQSHLSLLYRYFLFGNGTFVNGLKATLFAEIGLNHMGDCWPPKVFNLNLALQSLLLENSQHEYDDLITFFVRKTTADSPWSHPHAVEALNFLQLHYDATYPLNMVITPAILDKYNRIFTFLIQLLRVATVIKRCFEPLRNLQWYKTSTRDAICRYRFQMDQFTSALQSYIHDTAIEATWSSFMQHVQAMQSQRTSSNSNSNSSNDYVSVIMEPHSFRDYHEHVLDRILFQCFLKQSQTRIFKVLRPVLQDIVFFSVILDDYAAKDMESEDKLHMKCARIFDQFKNHSRVFVSVLQLLETKGSGRLTNVLNSTRPSIFNDLYARHEAKNGMDVFVKDLLTRLALNGYYSIRSGTEAPFSYFNENSSFNENGDSDTNFTR
ncbi:conserved hypothetical protein [Mucor ambiguus]|uniref:Spindle pole body component n=1 Tax=Mucor ambiguus TaxID=91626 RepID=A0A0C9M748_9FUNG|nr:conserved hypothetical protein [Mucor ambiguus]